MIAFVEGTLAQSWGRSCVIITPGGTGYEIALPGHTFASLPAIGEKISFYTSLAVREDALELYGFETFEERQTFVVLRTISKVGARTALAILTIFRPQDLRQAVLDDNIPALTKVPGIGAKTAQHILLELKYKLAVSNFSAAPAGTALQPSVHSDVMAALLNLGYTEEECSVHVKDILKAEPDLDVGSAIRLALKSLARGKN